MNRFALGTAQFGMKYGINNSSKVSLDINETEEILNFSLEKKIDKIILVIDSSKHLKEILKIDFKKNISGLPKISSTDESLINPSKWKVN